METWKIIKQNVKYSVSDHGNVKNNKTNKILKPSLDGGGHSIVCLVKNGQKKTHKIHKLVAIEFLDHKPNGMIDVVDHINNIKTDNSLNNLQITTQRVNSNKDRLTGTSKYTGVYYNKRANKWHASIVVDKKREHLGYFVKEIDAANAYKNRLNDL